MKVKLEVGEMKMLRRMCGVTRMDKIRNEKIRGTTKVVEISRKIQKTAVIWSCEAKGRGICGKK